jgi:hypothetical protein
VKIASVLINFTDFFIFSFYKGSVLSEALLLILWNIFRNDKKLNTRFHDVSYFHSFIIDWTYISNIFYSNHYPT